MLNYLAFDIGGTDVKYGVINEKFEFVYTSIMKTEAQKGGPSIITRICKIANDLKEQYEIKGVAVSSAGIINPYSGVVIYATDAIPGYIGVKIKEIIEKETKLPAEVLNDVKSFALCEGTIGAAKNCSDYLTLTVGTGIGGAIYADNKLVYGVDYSAGEWGRMIIDNHKFEELASISGLIGFAEEYNGKNNYNGKMIFDMYDSGDKNAAKAVDKFYHYLSTGIINLIYIFNPRKVIIGGGVTARGEKFRTELMNYIKEKIELKFLEHTQVLLAEYSNNSGMLGALINFKTMQMKRENHEI